MLINNGNNFTKFYFNLFLVIKKLPIITISNNTVKETTKSASINFETIIFKLLNNQIFWAVNISEQLLVQKLNI